MPPKKLKESITFLVNIGIARHGTQSNSQLLDKAKFILKHIIQKKIFLHPKDEIGVILMGSDCSKSNSIINLDSIRELCSMQVANWDLIESIDMLQSTNQSCSWMEAIYAAVEYIKHECVDKSVRKIILLSDFNEEEDIVDQFQIKDIVKTLSSEEILLIAIGERVLDGKDENSYTASETLLMNVLQKIDGHYFTLDHTMSIVRFYKPSSKPAPWSCDMELGDFHIPILGICRVPKEPKLPRLKLMANTGTSDMPDRQTPIKSVAQWTDKNRTIHTKEDMVSGYIYGGKPIPVTDNDKKSMNLKTNTKCYKIHGFTAKENVPMEYWLSDGTYVIIPASESVSAPFYSLVQAMVEKNVVAIVEKVYRKNCEANMVALFPSVVPDEPWRLIEIGLPFERDYGAITQRPLTKTMKQLSEEQSDAMDNLLASLELPDNADDDISDGSDKYLPEHMPDPGAQHMWDILSARALNPNQLLPSIADEVKNLLEQPKCIKEKCKPVTERIRNLYFLEKTEPLNTRKRYRAWKKDDNKKTDNNGGASTMQLVEEKAESVNNGNDNEANNTISLSNVQEFNFDDIADI